MTDDVEFDIQVSLDMWAHRAKGDWMDAKAIE